LLQRLAKEIAKDNPEVYREIFFWKKIWNQKKLSILFFFCFSEPNNKAVQYITVNRHCTKKIRTKYIAMCVGKLFLIFVMY
jgi:hypothetical protein